MSAFIQQIGPRAYQVTCPEHPQFRRVAWRTPHVPMESAHDHNSRHHGIGPVRIVSAPEAPLATLLA